MTEYLFFAIFGQKSIEDLTVSLKRRLQPNWTIVFFKVSFALYMLVSVIVLITLLIATMSDTYQTIQSQSDIEWKYGLSKLIRQMQKTQSAPPPWNLVTSWVVYFIKACKKKRTKRTKTNIGQSLSTQHHSSYSQDKGGYFSALQESPLGSQLSINSLPRIENVVDWDVVRLKYKNEFG